jgi:hypothetical protein
MSKTDAIGWYPHQNHSAERARCRLVVKGQNDVAKCLGLVAAVRFDSTVLALPQMAYQSAPEKIFLATQRQVHITFSNQLRAVENRHSGPNHRGLRRYPRRLDIDRYWRRDR